jgi:hypothetical protein
MMFRSSNGSARGRFRFFVGIAGGGARVVARTKIAAHHGRFLFRRHDLLIGIELVAGDLDIVVEGLAALHQHLVPRHDLTDDFVRRRLRLRPGRCHRHQQKTNRSQHSVHFNERPALGKPKMAEDRRAAK